MPTDEISKPLQPKSPQYVVVARRYRPKNFEELVGQRQVAQGLSGAITTNRVGHAYLFTGARGVGKTSTARIFAKALNCARGPTPTPCNECDICQSISSGEDVDVLEIDGASNRGIDEIRQLRSNVNVRPSRSHYKIYIIDEVHMLTTPAFNALLKTLEEPPEHVKFIFCTTDPEKIPITVLSRCQRFDFAPVEKDEIVERLRQIVQAEGVEADDQALQLLARRASGSMRDSQSLLEQLLAVCDRRITVDEVHAMLGTARGGRLAKIAEQIVARDTAAALAELDAAMSESVDVGQLAEQLLGYFRDMMAAVVGCDAELMLHSDPDDFSQFQEAGKQLGLETILAIVQILDQTVVRMRQTPHTRTLLEMALVRICKLEDLDQLSTLVAQLTEGGAAVAPPSPSRATAARRPSQADAPIKRDAEQKSAERPAQKKSEAEAAAAESSALQASATEVSLDLTSETAASVWEQAIDDLGGMAAEIARQYDSISVSSPNQLVVRFADEYHKVTCERPEWKTRLEEALAKRTGRQVRIDFDVQPGANKQTAKRKPQLSKRQRLREVEKHPLVRRAIELFDGEITEVNEAAPKSS